MVTGDPRDGRASSNFDRGDRANATAVSAAVPISLRMWLFGTGYAIVGYFALFWLPFYFPPRQRLVSASYAFGFNNGVAMLAMVVLLGAATLYRLLGGPRDPLLCFPDDSPHVTRLSGGLVTAMSAVYAGLTVGLYAYTLGAATAYLTWESRHFLHRIKLVETFGLRPYAEIHVEYGPALMYAPVYLHRLLPPFGVSIEAAYFLYHLLLNVAGLWCLWYLLQHAAAPLRAKAVTFVVVGMGGFALLQGDDWG